MTREESEHLLRTHQQSMLILHGVFLFTSAKNLHVIRKSITFLIAALMETYCYKVSHFATLCYAVRN